MSLALAGCGKDPLVGGSVATSDPSAGGQFDSPQAVFEAEKQAQIDKNWNAHFDTYSPESQERLVGSVAYSAIMLASAAGKEEEVNAVFQKHGIGEARIPKRPSTTEIANVQAMLKETEQQQDELVAAIKDKREFYAEMASLLGSAESEATMSDQMKEHADASEQALASAELTDLEITGETAVGNREIMFHGNNVKVPVYFTQIDGSWYMRQPTAEETQQLGEEISRSFSEKVQKETAEMKNLGKD